MKTVNIQDADLSILVEEAAAGEEIIIAKAGTPVARLVPIERPSEKNLVRRPGAMKGMIWIDDDTFDDPLPPELLKAFGVE